MKGTIFALAAGLVIASAAPATAIDEPQNVIRYRQAVMKAIGGHTAAIVAVVKGEVSYASHVAAHARGINEMSKLVTGLFPKGSGNDAFPDTRALPNIWDDWAKFEAAATAMEAESAKLAKVAESGDVMAIGAQLENLGKACGSCHKPFRMEKK